jgi:hypothetical protein
MTEEDELLNAVFLFLYNHKNLSFKLNELSTIPEFSMSSDIMKRLLYTLINDEFIYERDIQTSNGIDYNTFYQISSLGIKFIDKVPPEFTDRPYLYHLKLINDEEIKQRNKENLETNLSISVIRANRSSFWMMVIAGLTGLFILSQVVLLFLDSTPSKLQNLTLQLQKQSHILDSILLLHEKKDSSLVSPP